MSAPKGETEDPALEDVEPCRLLLIADLTFNDKVDLLLVEKSTGSSWGGDGALACWTIVNSPLFITCCLGGVIYLQLSPPLCFGTSRLIGASCGVTATTPDGASDVIGTGECDEAGREYG